MTEEIENWVEIPEDEISGMGYYHVVKCWKHKSGAEVMVFSTEDSGLEETEGFDDWAVQHPWDGENMEFAPTQEKAISMAKAWMRVNREAEDIY